MVLTFGTLVGIYYRAVIKLPKLIDLRIETCGLRIVRIFCADLNELFLIVRFVWTSKVFHENKSTLPEFLMFSNQAGQKLNPMHVCWN